MPGGEAMADRVIRPSMKQIKVLYVLALIAIIAVAAAYANYLYRQDPVKYPPWVPAIALIVLLVPIRRQIRRQAVKVTISGDKLRYDLGLLSKTTRNIQLSKVQDVRVDQRMSQRMFGVGDIAIETAGEASRLMLHNVDNPQALADEILNRAQHGPAPL